MTITSPSSGSPRRERPRLDRRGTGLGPAPGDGSAAALFPRSRYRRGSFSGGLPARAQDMAAERPAARRRGLADPGRPQRRDGRRAASRQAGGAARRGRAFQPRRCRKRSSPTGSTVPTTATTSCGCCSSAAIPSCRPRSRSRWPCASSAACRSSRSRAPSWWARPPWSSASPAPRRASPRPACRSRRPARQSVPSGWPSWPP